MPPPPTERVDASAGDARTGPLPLHPMSLGDLLDGSFRLYRANFRELAIALGLLALPAMVLAVLTAKPGLLVSVWYEPDSLATLQDPLASRGWLALLFTTITGPLASGACAVVAIHSFLGQPVTWREALGTAFRRWPALLVAQVIVHAAEAVAVVGLCVGPILAMALFVPVTPIVIGEKAGPIRAVSRSLKLVRGRYWPILGAALLSGLAIATATNLLTLAPSAIAAAVPIGWLAGVGQAVATLATALIQRPLTVMFATLVYFDTRIRFEGLDLQLLDRAKRGAPPGT